MTKVYHRGTLEEFDRWLGIVNTAEGIPHANYVRGELSPEESQWTMNYAQATPHPSGGDDYLWPFLDYPFDDIDQLTYSEAQTAGWYNRAT